MDAIQVLKQDHEKAKAMFQQIEQAGPQQRGQLWQQLQPELKLHEQMEEAHVYGPAAREAGGGDQTLATWEQRHHQEVEQAESMIAQISASDPTSDQWLQQVRQLKATLEKHIAEEEGTIWPRVGQVLDSSRLQQAGQQMMAMKQQATGRAA